MALIDTFLLGSIRFLRSVRSWVKVIPPSFGPSVITMTRFTLLSTYPASAALYTASTLVFRYVALVGSSAPTPERHFALLSAIGLVGTSCTYGCSSDRPLEK